MRFLVKPILIIIFVLKIQSICFKALAMPTKFYGGINLDYSVSKANAKQRYFQRFNKNRVEFSPIFGIRLNNYLAIEGGFSWNRRFNEVDFRNKDHKFKKALDQLLDFIDVRPTDHRELFTQFVMDMDRANDDDTLQNIMESYLKQSTEISMLISDFEKQLIGYCAKVRNLQSIENLQQILLNNLSSIRTKTAYFDIIGFLPISNKLELFGGIGLGKIWFSSEDIYGAKWHFKNKISLRTKTGFQYKLTDNLVCRFSGTYHKTSTIAELNNLKIKPFKNKFNISFGVLYNF